MSDTHDHLQALAALAHPEGGWGYAPGQAAHLEPTCLALLALAPEAARFTDVFEGGARYLRESACADGTFRLARGRQEAVWPTALALFTRVELGHPAEEVRRTAAALLHLRGAAADPKEAGEIHDIDVRLVGWPWAEGNFSWAEPTAWACLALRRAGLGDHPRVEEGLRLLLDRASDDGGINYGNRRILGRVTEPLPGPTAVMLLALQGRPEHPRVAAAVAYLQKTAPAGADLEHLCWARLALDPYRDLPGVVDTLTSLDREIDTSHAARAATPWLRPAPLRQALTALALGAGTRNPFRLESEAKAGPMPTPDVVVQTAERLKRPPLGERLKSAVQGMAVQAVEFLRQLPPKTEVHIARADDYNSDLAGVLKRQFQTFRERVPLAGKRVVLKPNLVEYHRDKVINTHPSVVAAAIELCKGEGAAEVIVAEGPGHCRNVEYLVSASGLGDVLRHYNVPFIDLNHDEPVKTPNLGRLTGLEFLYLARTVATADVLISMPKLKTHHWAGATLSLKNLFGTLPGICYGWPKNELHWRGIDNSIVDVALTRTPNLAIVDGVVGMEGDGPLNGTPKSMGVLVMGCDPVAVDATCCRAMRLNPDGIAYLVLGARKKLGLLREEHVQQVGEAIDAVAKPFETVEHLEKLRLGRPA